MTRLPKARNGSSRTGLRRAEIRRNLPRRASDARSFFARSDVLIGLLLLVALLATASAFVNWSREQVRVRDGQIMTETRLKRIDYTVEDEEATAAKREEARVASPRIYRPATAHIKRLEAAITGLPRAVAGRSTIEEIRPELVQEFQLTEDALAVLQPFVADGEPTQQWTRWVNDLVEVQLRRRPLLTSQEYQAFTTTASTAMSESPGALEPIRGRAIELRADARAETVATLRELATAAGFPPDVVPFIAVRLAFDMQPTFVHDPAETERAALAAAESVAPVLIEHKRGEVLYRRGDVLTAKQYEDAVTETQRFAAAAPWPRLWLPRIGIAGLLTVLFTFLAAHIAVTYPRIVRNALRITAIALLMGGMLVLSGLVVAHSPNLLLAAAVAPTLLVAVVVLLAYDQRLALMLSGLQCILVALALGLSVAWFVLLFAACGMMITQLRDVRHRNTLIRSASVTAIVLAAGAVLLMLFEVPLVAGAASHILIGSVQAFAASFAVGFLVLGILPSVERLFDITTGMTLAELRDPRQPLLRQLQQKAPGTYHHSHQVANIAEAAADAIGADSLLVYVGALYHDIGKMNKPDYFVENQAGGVNKHDKLSPAMSLLVIIGHVKDGVEMAREYNLPRALIHFIESHHGTTLVEYFYHAARTQAKQSDRSAVTEFEFRYPGPKPRTKEAAILMLADAVESATRAMGDPTAGRIENVVRDISRRRLLDGQFNQCDLTFRELGQIEDALISRLTSIYHGRISYPTPDEESEAPAAEAAAEPATESAPAAKASA
jgi:cyclic-di-AMP phosphodiesterase PgpH